MLECQEFVRNVLTGCQCVGNPDDLGQGGRGDDLLWCSVVKKDTVGEQTVERPLVREPGTDLAVVDAEGNAVGLRTGYDPQFPDD